MSVQDDLAYVINVARGAGEIIRAHFGKVERLTKTHQAASSEAVTIADRASQRFIVQELRKRFPGDGIVGEENETGSDITFECPDPAGRAWIIDPIDGTNNFIAGFEYFCVCIGLLEKGYPTLGVVYDVTRNRVYSAGKDHGAFLDGEPIRCTDSPLDDQAMLIITSNALDKGGRLPPFMCRWIAQTTWKIRCLGSAALDAVHVASGVAHGAITTNCKLWDVAASGAIVLEAGATMTDPAGKPIFPFDLRNYAGAKVPFLAAAPQATAKLVREIADPTLPKFQTP